MKTSYVKLVFLALALSMTVACGKRDEPTANVGEARGANAIAGAPYVNLTSSVTGVNFTNLVKAFLAPTISPSSVGNVSSSGGVRFGGKILTNPNNGQILPDSQIQLEIVDDLVGKTDPKTNQPYTSIYVTMKGGLTDNSTAWNQNFNITFSDEFGTINVQGQFVKNGQMTGTVSFRNASESYNGINSGTLGTFSMPTCSFFVCN